jgi:hypothetical protein
MSSHVRILGIAGSLRRGPYNQAAKEFGGLDPPNFACTGKYPSIQHGNCAASD